MQDEQQAKIAFLYPALKAAGVVPGDPTPGVAIECNEFPSQISLPVNFGVIGFNGIDNYSLDVKVIFNGEDVTAPLQGTRSVFAYTPEWGNDGEYVATMTITEAFIAKAPGYYSIEALLLFKTTDPESSWAIIDLKQSHFSVSKKWSKNIDG